MKHYLEKLIICICVFLGFSSIAQECNYGDYGKFNAMDSNHYCFHNKLSESFYNYFMYNKAIDKKCYKIRCTVQKTYLPELKNSMYPGYPVGSINFSVKFLEIEDLNQFSLDTLQLSIPFDFVRRMPESTLIDSVLWELDQVFVLSKSYKVTEFCVSIKDKFYKVRIKTKNNKTMLEKLCSIDNLPSYLIEEIMPTIEITNKSKSVITEMTRRQ